MVESKLKNYRRAVDHDSLGIMQQRPSQGWGKPAYLKKPAYASFRYYEEAKRLDRKGKSAGKLAAEVQKPFKAYRGRYAKQMPKATRLMDELERERRRG